MATITGHTVLVEADHVVAEAALPKQARWPKRMAVGAGVALMLRLSLKDMEMNWSRARQLSMFVNVLIFLGVAFGLGRWLTARHSPQQLMARLGLVHNVLTVKVDEEGLIYGLSRKRAWHELRHFTENELAFVVYGNDSLLHVIPKRAFAPGDVPRVRALMHDNIRKKAAWGGLGSTALGEALWRVCSGVMRPNSGAFHALSAPSDKEYEPNASEVPLTADFEPAAEKRVQPDNYRNELTRIERELIQLERAEQ